MFYFTRPIAENAAEFAKMAAVERFVPGFVHDPELIEAHGVNPDSGVVDAYSYLAPTIDTDWYLAWLAQQAGAAGVTVARRELRGRSPSRKHELARRSTGRS